MLTQCPGCQTVFRITSAILRAAHGQVRCGRCNTQFDAIEYLQEEEASAEAAEQAAPAAAEQGEQVTAEFAPTSFDAGSVQHEEITLEGNRIEISGVYRAPAAEESVEEHTHTVIEEFNIDTEEWQNPFIEAEPEANTDDAAAAELSKAIASLEPEEERIELTSLSDDDVADDEEEGKDNEEIVVQFEPEQDLLAVEDRVAESAPTEHTDTVAPQAEEPKPETAAPITYATIPGLAEIEAQPSEAIEYEAAPEPIATAPQTFNEFIDREPKPRRWPWAVLSVIAVLALLAQIVNHYRQELVRHPTFGPPLARAYAMFGLKLEPRWSLAAYTIKQWGIVSDPQALGTLRVRASITNNAQFAQPYPLLKLTLEDRFGANLGTREFKPEEYLSSPSTAVRRLDAGAAADVDLAIVDPGEDAVGFQFDVCLQDSAVHCAHDIAGS